MATSVSAKIEPIIAHVKACLERHRPTSVASESGGVNVNSKAVPTLFVAFQGPQGSGKTFLTSHLHKALSAPPHNLSVAVLSIDDLYLPHDGLVHVARTHPNNRLLAGRGQPGTHDVPLGTRLLEELSAINDNLYLSSESGGSEKDGADRKEVRFPFFDKSLYDGEGDRVADGGPIVRPPLDVVLFEGWCVGFCPTNPDEIRRRFAQHMPDLEGILDLQAVFKEEDIFQINQNLWDYTKWWEFFDVFIQVKPPDSTPYSLIYKWRLQQEHDMKGKNGGRGMTDEQVKTFVDRYIPGYVFFADGIEHGYVGASGVRHAPRWLGNGLKVAIDEERNLVSVDKF
ncbi:P-loop containing nucleoside triphosphate hydrolase protein [Fomitiporia mediterranea MF3/22]|uniref:P-loop containing nucleoside triphosphate hydrolase protein n=1 Tax=Fomitiporia mediterranea (strain MF3/22) TaxID=694068 RepID=UPI0004408778|nr:P-loop containing nucleoside triphosphate hydrolase protein [Fomitiporia mediterranea MF3/22]EJD08061.1 P-loop containing nucleoside triphosphate hydrolase protein [Fomitiporia mediterranea MF3/22]